MHRALLLLTAMLVLASCGPPVPQSTMPADFPPLWSLAPPEYSLQQLEGIADRSCVRVSTPDPEPLSALPGAEAPAWTQQLCRDFGAFVAQETGRTVAQTVVADIIDLEGEGAPEISCQLICPDQDCGFFLLTEGAAGCWVPDYAD